MNVAKNDFVDSGKKKFLANFLRNFSSDLKFPLSPLSGGVVYETVSYVHIGSLDKRMKQPTWSRTNFSSSFFENELFVKVVIWVNNIQTQNLAIEIF